MSHLRPHSFRSSNRWWALYGRLEWRCRRSTQQTAPGSSPTAAATTASRDPVSRCMECRLRRRCRCCPACALASRIESRITRLITVAPGDTVGYNRTFRADAPMRAALLPIGYADGYRRALSGRAWVGIDGRQAPVIGRVSMDQIVVGIPDGARAALGDIVTVMGGDQRSGAPSIEDMADLMGTNGYEVLVGIRKRVPRVFLRDGEPVAARVSGNTEIWIEPSSDPIQI